MPKLATLLALALSALLVASGCGGGGDDGATPTPSPVDTPCTYTVRAGDVLSTLADRFNISLDDLMKANDIADPNLIQAGQELAIPCPEGVMRPDSALGSPQPLWGAKLIRICKNHGPGHSSGAGGQDPGGC